MIKKTYKDLLTFLKKPTDQKDSEQKISFKSKRLLAILAIDIPLMGILLLIIYGLEQLGLLGTASHKAIKFFQLLPVWLIILFGSLILPFIEELIFRLYLRLKENYPLKLLIFLISLIGLKSKEQVNIYIETKWQNYYKVIFYLSALIFGFVHIANYEYSFMLLLFSPIIIAPQFLLGLFIGYLRVKYGLLWGFFLHGLHNLIFLAVLFLLIFMSGPVEKLNISNEQYKLKIEEIGFGEINSSSTCFSEDSVFIKNLKLKQIMSFLIDKEAKLIQFNPKIKSDLKINLTFIKHIDSINPKQIILNKLQTAYGFKIITDDRLQEIWELQISDTLLLKQYKNDSSKFSKTKFSSKEINMENVDLTQLVHTLNSNYDKYILTTIDMSDKFNFKFQKTGFDELNNHLEREYGLFLTKSEMEIEYILINFIDDKINDN